MPANFMDAWFTLPLPLAHINMHQRDKREDIRLMAINDSLDIFCMYLFR